MKGFYIYSGLYNTLCIKHPAINQIPKYAVHATVLPNWETTGSEEYSTWMYWNYEKVQRFDSVANINIFRVIRCKLYLSPGSRHLPCLQCVTFKSLSKCNQTEWLTLSPSTSGPVIACELHSCHSKSPTMPTHMQHGGIRRGSGTDALWQASHSWRHFSQTSDAADGWKGNASLIESKVKSHRFLCHPVNWQCVSLTLQEHFQSL